MFRRQTALLLASILTFFTSGCYQNGSIPYAGTSGRPSACLDTDEQLRAPVARKAPREKAAYEKWMAQNAVPVRSETCDTDFSDLRPFGAIVGQKRIVGLGESSHGVGDYSSLKVRLIKYLHEDLGFDVIAFEYSMFEDYMVNRAIRSLSPKEAMWHGCYGVWWSTQALPLFQYIKEQSTTAHPLILAGFDVQQYVDLKRRADTFRSVITPVDAAYADKVAQQDFKYMKFLTTYTSPPSKKWRRELRTMLPRLTEFYNGLSTWIGKHMKRLIAYSDDPNLPGLMQQVANGSPASARELYVLNNDRSNSERDIGMADNVKYLATTLYPGKKIMLWSHDVHIATGQTGWKSMGSVIKRDFGDAYYATGLLPFRGHGALNSEQIYKEPIPPTRSIDAMLYYARWRWAYVDMSQQLRTAGNRWMWGPTLEYDYFGYYDIMPPAIANRLFDGLMYVYLIHPPTYLFPKRPPLVERN
jgi:erythromycin esterase